MADVNTDLRAVLALLLYIRKRHPPFWRHGVQHGSAGPGDAERHRETGSCRFRRASGETGRQAARLQEPSVTVQRESHTRSRESVKFLSAVGNSAGRLEDRLGLKQHDARVGRSYKKTKKKKHSDKKEEQEGRCFSKFSIKSQRG